MRVFLRHLVILLGIWTHQVFASENTDQLAAADAAIKAREWQTATQIYEGILTDGTLTPGLLHNLALGYMGRGMASQAAACWVAAVELSPQDTSIRDGLQSALGGRLNATDAMDMSAQGPLIALMASHRWWNTTDVVILSAGFLALTGMLGLSLWMSGATLRFIGALKSSLIACAIVSSLLWASLGTWYLFGGYWGAVVQGGGDTVWSAPVGSPGASALGKLEEGTPVYVTSPLEAGTVKVYAADGTSGWMNALSVRVIKTLR